MDAMMSTPAIADFNLNAGALSRTGLAGPLVRAGVFTCAGILLFAAGFLWFRRAVGAISTPLSASSLVAVGLAVAGAAVTARFVWRRSGASRRSTFIISGLITVSALATAAATSLPGSSPAGLAGLWLIVAAEEFWAWRPRRLVRSVPPVPALSRESRPVPIHDSRKQFEQAVADSVFGLDVVQEHVTQQVTRLVEPDGTERVVGWMRVSFEPGQRLASVHLAFCPPFQRTPEAALERLDGPEVRIKRVQAFPFGARFDLKLEAPAEQRADVLLQVAAEVQGQQAAGDVTADSDEPSS